MARALRYPAANNSRAVALATSAGTLAFSSVLSTRSWYSGPGRSVRRIPVSSAYVRPWRPSSSLTIRSGFPGMSAVRPGGRDLRPGRSLVLVLVLVRGQVADGHHAHRGAVGDDRQAAHGPVTDDPGGRRHVVVRAEHGQLATADVAQAGGTRIAVLGQDPDRDVPVGDEPAELAPGQDQHGTDAPLLHGPGGGRHRFAGCHAHRRGRHDLPHFPGHGAPPG